MGTEALIGAGATVLGGVAGGLFGSEPKSNKTTTSSAPWKSQQPYLLGGFKGAAGDLAAKANTPYFQGDMYANMDPLMLEAINKSSTFARGQGDQLGQNFLSRGSPFLDQGGNFINSANALAGTQLGDPTQANIDAASRYADNPYMDGMIDSASRDVTRNLTEDVLPQINRNAVGGGNTNSTRTGIAEGLALRGAQDRIGDISSEMRGAAYDAGLSRAEAGRQFNEGAGLDARIAGAGFQDQGYGRGMDTTLQGIQQILNNYDVLGRAGGANQADAQGNLDEAFAKWQGGDTRMNDLLNRYMGLVTGNYGGQSSATASSGGGLQGTVQGILGGASTGLGLYKDLSNIFNSSGSSSLMRDPNGAAYGR